MSSGEDTACSEFSLCFLLPSCESPLLPPRCFKFCLWGRLNCWFQIQILLLPFRVLLCYSDNGWENAWNYCLSICVCKYTVHVCVCLYAYMYVCMYVHVVCVHTCVICKCIHLCICIPRPEEEDGCHSRITLHFVFWDRDSLSDLKLVVRKGWLTREPLGETPAHSVGATGTYSCHACLTFTGC